MGHQTSLRSVQSLNAVIRFNQVLLRCKVVKIFALLTVACVHRQAFPYVLDWFLMFHIVYKHESSHKLRLFSCYRTPDFEIAI